MILRPEPKHSLCKFDELSFVNYYPNRRQNGNLKGNIYYMGIYGISSLSMTSQGDIHIGIAMLNGSGKINGN